MLNRFLITAGAGGVNYTLKICSCGKEGYKDNKSRQNANENANQINWHQIQNN
jgi:hypothetical protein